MILDLEPIRDEENGRKGRAEKDTSFGGLMITILVIVLLIACGTSFGIGYAVGHYYTPPDAEKPTVQTAAVTTAKEVPLAAAGATQAILAPAAFDTPMSGLSKPPAPTPAPVAKPADKPQPKPVVAAPQSKPVAAPQTKPVVTQVAHAKPSAGQSAKGKPSPSSSAKHSPPHGAAFAHNSTPARGADPFIHLISNPNYGVESSPSSSHQPMVQVAVLTRDEDASVLIDALSRHGYSASSTRESDHRIHIRLGPFSSRTDASAMRDKLLNDGYNAVVQ
jgi:hypothetical protein